MFAEGQRFDNCMGLAEASPTLVMSIEIFLFIYICYVYTHTVVQLQFTSVGFAKARPIDRL